MIKLTDDVVDLSGQILRAKQEAEVQKREKELALRRLHDMQTAKIPVPGSIVNVSRSNISLDSISLRGGGTGFGYGPA